MGLVAFKGFVVQGRGAGAIGKCEKHMTHDIVLLQASCNSRTSYTRNLV